MLDHDPSALRAIFPANLRILLEDKKSVAHTCREIGINRTQFNRYLAGESFPRPDVLHRLCSYFDVDARVLLEPIEDTRNEVADRKELAAQLAWANDDAARYQYLRNRDLDAIHEGGIFAGMTPDNFVLNEEDLDQAIDNAIETERLDQLAAIITEESPLNNEGNSGVLGAASERPTRTHSDSRTM